MDVVVYYQSRPSEPEASQKAMMERHAVAEWMTVNPSTISAEHTELETDGFSRPHLRAAMEACKKAGATLLIAWTEAIGSGGGEPDGPRTVQNAEAPPVVERVRHEVEGPTLIGSLRDRQWRPGAQCPLPAAAFAHGQGASR